MHLYLSILSLVYISLDKVMFLSTLRYDDIIFKTFLASFKSILQIFDKNSADKSLEGSVFFASA